MKGIMRAIDRFCARHPRFGIPNLMLVIVVGNAVTFVLTMIDTTGLLYHNLMLNIGAVLNGQVWRLLSFVFVMPSRNFFLGLFFLYCYYIVGSMLEREWGPGKLTIYYLFGILIHIIFGLITYFIGRVSFGITGYYLNLSVLFIFATLFPDMQMVLYYVIPLKAKWMALINGVVFIYDIVVTPFPVNLVPILAILNYLFFCGGDLLNNIAPGRQKYSRDHAAATVNFKRAKRKIQRDMEKQEYSRKCSVCGRTDKDYPELEFRYCSRCEGYHCFCIDHINNHKHY